VTFDKMAGFVSGHAFRRAEKAAHDCAFRRCAFHNGTVDRCDANNLAESKSRVFIILNYVDSETPHRAVPNRRSTQNLLRHNFNP